MKNINQKLKNLVRQLATLNDTDLQKALKNRGVLDQFYLMRKSKIKLDLLEQLTFTENIFLEKINKQLA